MTARRPRGPSQPPPRRAGLGSLARAALVPDGTIDVGFPDGWSVRVRAGPFTGRRTADPVDGRSSEVSRD